MNFIDSSAGANMSSSTARPHPEATIPSIPSSDIRRAMCASLLSVTMLSTPAGSPACSKNL